MYSNYSQSFYESFDLFSVNVSMFSYVLIYEWIGFVWHLCLLRRQYKIFKSVWEVPTQLIQVIDEDILRKARNYGIDKTRFGFFASFWRQLLKTIVIWFELIPLLWEYSGSYGSDNEILQTIVFVVTGSLIVTIIDLPLSLYSKFVIEQRYGFNKQTAGLYAIKKIKKFVIIQTIIAAFISGLIWINQNGNQFLFVFFSMLFIVVFNDLIVQQFDETNPLSVGDFPVQNAVQHFFIYLWAFCLLMAMVFITVFNDFIAPLFDKFSLLPNGDLSNQIENMAKTIVIPFKNMFVIEGSERSYHSKAYTFCLFKNKLIIITDTLFEGFPEQQETEEQTNGSEEESNQTEHQRVGFNDNQILAILFEESLQSTLKQLTKPIWLFYRTKSPSCLLNLSQEFCTNFGFGNNCSVFIGFYLNIRYYLLPIIELSRLLVWPVATRLFASTIDTLTKDRNRAADARSSLIKLNEDILVFPLNDWLNSIRN